MYSPSFLYFLFQIIFCLFCCFPVSLESVGILLPVIALKAGKGSAGGLPDPKKGFGHPWMPVAALWPEQGFGCSSSFVYLCLGASTEQGLPARRPCTRALLGEVANHCPLSRVTLAASPGFRAGPDALPARLALSRASCPLTRPCDFTRQ